MGNPARGHGLRGIFTHVVIRRQSHLGAATDVKSTLVNITVDLGDRSYPILIGDGAAAHLPKLLATHGGQKQVVVVADETVFRLHGAALSAALPSVTALTFPAGETSKSLTQVERLCDELARLRVERDGLLIAFGGGVAGDLGGFVAAAWLRGIAFIQVPTTLLAAVDASVGGKTGVNLRAGKNLVGAFHQPRAVVIDTRFLATLPRRDFAAGLAESVKHAAIREPAFLDWHEVHAEVFATFPKETANGKAADIVAGLIGRNCAIKAAVVGCDEREAGLRAILNYGHTIGHAFEHVLEYELRHGECVALGMRVENEIARRRGWLSATDAERIAALLDRLGLPARLSRALDPADVWSACQVDKKVRDGRVNFVLLRALGQPERVADVTEGEVAAALPAVQAT